MSKGGLISAKDFQKMLDAIASNGEIQYVLFLLVASALAFMLVMTSPTPKKEEPLANSSSINNNSSNNSSVVLVQDAGAQRSFPHVGSHSTDSWDGPLGVDHSEGASSSQVQENLLSQGDVVAPFAMPPLVSQQRTESMASTAVSPRPFNIGEFIKHMIYPGIQVIKAKEGFGEFKRRTLRLNEKNNKMFWSEGGWSRAFTGGARVKEWHLDRILSVTAPTEAEDRKFDEVGSEYPGMRSFTLELADKVDAKGFIVRRKQYMLLFERPGGETMRKWLIDGFNAIISDIKDFPHKYEPISEKSRLMRENLNKNIVCAGGGGAGGVGVGVDEGGGGVGGVSVGGQGNIPYEVGGEGKCDEDDDVSQASCITDVSTVASSTDGDKSRKGFSIRSLFSPSSTAVSKKPTPFQQQQQQQQAAVAARALAAGEGDGGGGGGRGGSQRWPAQSPLGPHRVPFPDDVSTSSQHASFAIPPPPNGHK